MAAILTVDPRSGVPIYVQLTDQIKRAVALGTLAPGEQLPTVKTLAVDLTINPNTVARVYRELERDGIIETSPGRGSFVRHDGALGQARRDVDEMAYLAIESAIREAKSLGLDAEAATRLYERAIARWFGAPGVPNEERT